LFMVQRHAKASFGAAYAFPGGVIDDDDAELDDYCDGRASVDASEVLGLTSGGTAYFVGAIRELFEETGVLLAACEHPGVELDCLRSKLNNHTASWLDFLKCSGARMLCGELIYFGHWITPKQMAKRYTTRFFMAAMPQDQVAEHDKGELTDSIWISARGALRAGQEGSIKLHYPTIKTLESIANHQSVDELLDWANRCEANGVVPIEPVLPRGAA